MVEAEGYASFLPASFYSRGSFDWNDDPLPNVTVEQRLWLRTHDVLGAQRWLCGHPRVDCGRTAIVGFSNGGSSLVLSQYAGLSEHPDFPDALVPPPSGRAKVAVAFYPGCGLYGMVPLRDGDYRPRVPLLMFHGARDGLLRDCETRVEQSQRYGGGVEHQIYADVGHGFDSDPHGTAEHRAQVETRALTLRRLHEAFYR